MSATSITKQSAWICFTACVVVTSDTMSSTPEFQRDSVSDEWITGRPNLTTFVLVKSSRSGRVIYCLRRAFLLYWPRLTTVSLDSSPMVEAICTKFSTDSLSLRASTVHVANI